MRRIAGDPVETVALLAFLEVTLDPKGEIFSACQLAVVEKIVDALSSPTCLKLSPQFLLGALLYH
jgi:hypothetical protein